MNYEAFRVMDVPDLVRAITLDRTDYEEMFLTSAQRELERRGLDLAEFTDRVVVATEGGDATESSAAEAVAALGKTGDVWELTAYTSCLGDVMVVQKEIRRWVCHCYEESAYSGSTFAPDVEAARQVLTRFLSLNADALDSVEWQDLDTWREVTASRSRRYTARVAADLDSADITNTVRPPAFTDTRDKEYSVLVHEEDEPAALTVVEDIQRKVRALCDQAEALSQGSQRERELELYDLLCDLAPDKPAVHYNRGSVLLEMERWDAAAEALAEALHLAVESLRAPAAWQGSRPARPGGFAGLAAWLLGHKPPESQAPPKYPDYVDDIEMLFDRIHHQVPANKTALHGLATIFQLKDDATALAQWSRRILDIDPDDEAARVNLSYALSALDTAAEEVTPDDAA